MPLIFGRNSLAESDTRFPLGSILNVSLIVCIPFVSGYLESAPHYMHRVSVNARALSIVVQLEFFHQIELPFHYLS